MAWMSLQYLVFHWKTEVKNMPEIRASVTVEVHRKLKEEAARNGKHLKELINEILIMHIKNGAGGGKGKADKKAW
jgi:hypothetical protein